MWPTEPARSARAIVTTLVLLLAAMLVAGAGLAWYGLQQDRSATASLRAQADNSVTDRLHLKDERSLRHADPAPPQSQGTHPGASIAAAAPISRGSSLWRWFAPLALLSTALSATLLVALVRTLAKREELAHQLDTLTRTDALTSVANRRAWDEELPRMLERGKRTGLPLCVALISLDHFKTFNAERGHAAGDQLLCDAAAAFRAELRKDDQIARYGGEEFALLLNGCHAEQARALLERLSRSMPLQQAFSTSIVQCDGSEDPQAVVTLAERTLHEAKNVGRRAVVANKAAHNVLPLALGKPEPRLAALR